MKRIPSILIALCTGLSLAAHAQTRPQADTVRKLPGGLIQITFSDLARGLPDSYLLESSSTLTSGQWVEQNAIINGNNGSYVASALIGNLPSQFFRIRSRNAPIPGDLPIASFRDAKLTHDEGDGTIAVVVEFTQSYSGLLKYSWAGSASVNGLSGLIEVNGQSAIIPLTIQDDMQIGELENLTLNLLADENAAYRIAPDGATSNLTIRENDASWKGNFQSDSEMVDLEIELIHRGVQVSARVISDGTGLIPAGTYESTTTPIVSSNQFTANFTDIPIPANAKNRLGNDIRLSLSFDAQNGRPDDRVEEQRIAGQAEVVIGHTGSAYLNTTLLGRFHLAKAISAPSSAAVPLTR